MTQCGAISSSGRLCQREATVELTAMCVHEHRRTGFICEKHAQVWRSGHVVQCSECLFGGDSHLCPVAEVAS